MKINLLSVTLKAHSDQSVIRDRKCFRFHADFVLVSNQSDVFSVLPDGFNSFLQEVEP